MGKVRRPGGDTLAAGVGPEYRAAGSLQYVLVAAHATGRGNGGRGGGGSREAALGTLGSSTRDWADWRDGSRGRQRGFAAPPISGLHLQVGMLIASDASRWGR
jgi:hypothetical protein